MNEEPDSTIKAIGKDSRALRHPVLLGSLGVGILSFLLPIYGKQMGGSGYGMYTLAANLGATVGPLSNLPPATY